MSGESLDKLILRFVAATFGQEDWRPLLRDAAAVVKANSVHILMTETALAEDSFHADWNFPADYWAPYISYYYSKDVWTSAGEAMLDGRTRLMFSDNALDMDSEYLKSEIYNDFSKSFDVVHFLSFEDRGLTFGPPGAGLRLGFYRGLRDERFGPREHAFMARMMDVLPVTFGVADGMMGPLFAGRAALSFLDSADDGIVVISSGLAVLHVNPAGAAILEQGLARRTLSGWALGAPLLGALARLSRLKRDTSPDRIEVVQTSGQLRVVVQLTLIAEPLRSFSGTKAAFVLVLRRIDGEAARVHWGAIEETFGLTSSELRVLKNIVDGNSLPDIARSTGVSLETVRTQAKALLRKTVSRSRGQLINLVLNTFTSSLKLRK
jgi:DNA-binding CsgD family transcriptional regulator